MLAQLRSIVLIQGGRSKFDCGKVKRSFVSVHVIPLLTHPRIAEEGPEHYL